MRGKNMDKMTKHQISRKIFHNLYGRYPHNVTDNYEEKNRLDKVRRQTNRSISSFSMLWSDFQTKENGKIYINENVANLLIIEVVSRFKQINTSQNTKRTKVVTYVIKKDWNKLNTHALGVFFMPFLNAFEVESPEYVKNFKRKLYAVSQIDDNITEFFDSLLTQKI